MLRDSQAKPRTYDQVQTVEDIGLVYTSMAFPTRTAIVFPDQGE